MSKNPSFQVLIWETFFPAMAYKSVFDVSVIKSDFESAGVNPSFIPLIWKHVLKNPNCRWEEVPSLPSVVYHILNSKFKPCTSTLHSAEHSSDQVTTKLLIKLKVNWVDYHWFYLITIGSLLWLYIMCWSLKFSNCKLFWNCGFSCG